MSDAYIRRLRGIEAEFNAAQQSLAYVERNWQRHVLDSEFRRTGPRDLTQAIRNVETTYFIRLYAEFEGILKDHFETNHSGLTVPDKPKVDWLISRVSHAEGITLDPILRRRMDTVRDYRNSIAHRIRGAAPAVLLVDALSVLNRFLAKLPEPLI